MGRHWRPVALAARLLVQHHDYDRARKKVRRSPHERAGPLLGTAWMNCDYLRCDLQLRSLYPLTKVSLRLNLNPSILATYS